MRSKIDHKFTNVDYFSIILVCVILICILHVAFRPVTIETFRVHTTAGETYDIKTAHKCDEYLKRAVTQVFLPQDKPLNPLGVRALTVLSMDITRANEGHVAKQRCEIKVLDIKKVSK